MDGVAYLAGQIAVPLVLATVAGVLIGHVVWPRRTVTDPAAELVAARDEAATLRAALATVTDRKDTEIGRLETGAIQAMETTMASSQQRIGDLEARLQESAQECRRLEVRLQSEQSRTARLEAALVERDRRILELSSPPSPPA